MGRLIDVDRLCNDLAKRWSIADKKKEDLIRAVMADVVTPIVVSQPTVDAVPVRHGKWIQFPTHMAYKCSECGRVIQTTDGRRNVSKHYPFCHCGADMRGDHHDD